MRPRRDAHSARARITSRMMRDLSATGEHDAGVARDGRQLLAVAGDRSLELAALAGVVLAAAVALQVLAARGPAVYHRMAPRGVADRRDVLGRVADDLDEG